MKMNEKKLKLIALILLILATCIISYKLFLKNEDTKYIIALDYNTLIEKINNKESFPIVVTKDGCTYCEAFLPKVKEVAKTNKIIIYNINTSLYSAEEIENLNKYFYVASTPTTLFIINGEEVTVTNRIVGDTNKEELINKLKTNKYIKE
jgi:predicted bacteriocin transport accessory protein